MRKQAKTKFRRRVKEAVLLVLMITPFTCSAMDNYDNPRYIRSFSDRDLKGSLDILNVTAQVVSDNLVEFKVKLREPPMQNDQNVLLIKLLQQQDLYIAISSGSTNAEVLTGIHQASLSSLQTASEAEGVQFGKDRLILEEAVSIHRKVVKVNLPMTLFDLGHPMVYDAFTADISTEKILKVYDQAAKGRLTPKEIYPMALFNKMCLGNI